MKPWSFYNTLFRSEKSGFFLYNALSGFMLELDKEHYETAAGLREGREGFEPQKDSEFPAFLEEHGFLAQREDELLQLMQLQYDRNAACFSTSTIGLTICPTLFCNFSCSYCFEHSQSDPEIMSENTMDALISFIKKHKEAKSLKVNWYGGEPTLAFDVVTGLTARFRELYPDFDNAGLITNAYLLDGKWIDELANLKITTIQITFDGSESTHNSRRMLTGGGPTYRNILDNIDMLMNSSWNGRVAIRVNVDRFNRDEFAGLRKELLERYAGKNLVVRPGYITVPHSHPYGSHSGLSVSEWKDFLFDGYKTGAIVPHGGYFPQSGAVNTCTATSRFGYVIGPRGEIYKCLEDVGNGKMVIGSVYDVEAVRNKDIVARYATVADPFNDKTCMECSCFPVCGGGCVNKRMRMKQFGEEGLECCAPVRYSLVQALESYLDQRRTKEICDALLGKKEGPDMKQGYRLVHPEQHRHRGVGNPIAKQGSYAGACLPIS